MSTLVCMVHCYNSEKWLKQCLDSIFSQKTKHQFQVLIIDDCSTDNTKNIAHNFIKNHSNLHFFSTKKNTGLGKHALLDLEEEIKPFFNTDYIYRIDSDDFIIDSSKFEKQISYLDKNLDCVGICHHYRVDDEINNKSYINNAALVGTFSSAEVVKLINKANLYNQTATYLFRNIDKDIMPTKFKLTKWASGDVLYTWNMMKYGSICFTDDVMSVYRLHKGGAYNSKKDSKKKKANRSLLTMVFIFMSPRNKLLRLKILAHEGLIILLKKVIIKPINTIKNKLINLKKNER